MINRGHQPDSILLVVLAAIVLFGLIAVSSASTVVAHQQYGDSGYLLKQQLVSALLGILCFAATYRIDYRIWKRFAFPLLIVSIGMLVAVFIPGIGVTLQGAQRWVHFGPRLFQPAEIVKLLFLIYLAKWLSQRGKEIHDRSSGLWPFLTVLGIITLLIMKQPDMGTMTIILVIALSSYFIAGAPIRDFVLISGITVAAFTILVKMAPYRAQRLMVFLNPQLDPQGIGYHVTQSVLAIASGGLFGVGLGHSRQKFNYLPEAASDSIFAVIAEELGLIVALMLIGLFVVFIVRGYRIAQNAPDDFSKILAAGITTWFGFQAFINIAALSRLLPLTGIPLPFVSYGGTALITSLAAVGILANISKHAKL